MATQLITVVGVIGRMDAQKRDSVIRRPTCLPVIYYSQWMDSWSMMLEFRSHLKRRPFKGWHKGPILRMVLSHKDIREAKKLRNRLRKRTTNPLALKFCEEVYAASDAIRPWGGTILVHIKATGPSIHNDDIIKYKARHSRRRRR